MSVNAAGRLQHSTEVPRTARLSLRRSNGVGGGGSGSGRGGESALVAVAAVARRERSENKLRQRGGGGGPGSVGDTPPACSDASTQSHLVTQSKRTTKHWRACTSIAGPFTLSSMLFTLTLRFLLCGMQALCTQRASVQACGLQLNLWTWLPISNVTLSHTKSA